MLLDQAKHMSLSDVTRTLVDMIVKRAKQGNGRTDGHVDDVVACLSL